MQDEQNAQLKTETCFSFFVFWTVFTKTLKRSFIRLIAIAALAADNIRLILTIITKTNSAFCMGKIAPISCNNAFDSKSVSLRNYSFHTINVLQKQPFCIFVTMFLINRQTRCIEADVIIWSYRLQNVVQYAFSVNVSINCINMRWYISIEIRIWCEATDRFRKFRGMLA